MPKISEYPEATTLDDADQFVINDSGTTKRITKANVRKAMSDWLSPTDYGPGVMAGNATTDTAALQWAVDNTPQGGTVFIPASSTQPLRLNGPVNIAKKLTIRGEGWTCKATSRWATDTASYTNWGDLVSGSLIHMVGATARLQIIHTGASLYRGLDLYDVGLIGDGTAGQHGVAETLPTFNHWANTLLANLAVGYSTSSQSSEYDFVRMYGCQAGVSAQTPGAPHNSNTWTGAQMTGCDVGFDLEHGSTNVFVGGSWQGCFVSTFKANGTGNTIKGIYFENLNRTGPDIHIKSLAHRTSVEHCHFGHEAVVSGEPNIHIQAQSCSVLWPESMPSIEHDSWGLTLMGRHVAPLGTNPTLGTRVKVCSESGSIHVAETLRTGAGATGDRPILSNTSPGLVTLDPGTQWYDTTIGKPIWWNGTVWKDAAGTTV